MTIDHVNLSIKRALEGQSNLSQDQLSVRGFSTPTIRRFMSNLCNISGTYLEIGLYCGGTFVSAFNQNLTAIGIEDHSQDFSAGFDQVKKELKENVDKFSDRAKEVHVHYEDCFKMDKSALPDNIDIYYYDGHHDQHFQRKAISFFIDKLADSALIIVDDVNWPQVLEGTIQGFEDVADKIEIERVWELRGELLDNDPVFHNGVNLYLINKKK